MKRILLATLVLFPLSLTAGLPLKMELIGPEEPVAISEKKLASVKAVARAVKELQALRDLGKLEDKDIEKMAKTEALLNEGRKLEQGIELKLRFTNPTDKPITFHYGPDTSTIFITVDGPGAVDLPYSGMMTLEFRQPEPTTIAPGKSKEFTITEMAYGQRDMSRWLISEPGLYGVRALFTAVAEDGKVELKSNEITLEVKAGE